MPEFCIVNDEGVVEDGFASREEASHILEERYSEEDDCEIDDRHLYDEDGYWIEDEDE